MSNEWGRENGKECLWYAENPLTKRIYFTSPMSPIRPGWVRKSTTSPREMDRIFDRMHAQEREQNERMLEQLASRGREYYERVRSTMRDRLNSAGVSDAEKNIIRACFRLMDEKDSNMQKNTVRGVSALQEMDEHQYKVRNEEAEHEKEIRKQTVN